jgi:hypothetical protein
VSKPNPFPLYPHQRKAVEDILSAHKDGAPVVLSFPRPAGRATILRAVEHAMTEVPAPLANKKPARLHRPGVKPAPRVVIDTAESELIRDSLGDKGREVQRLQADFARMFGTKK